MSDMRKPPAPAERGRQCEIYHIRFLALGRPGERQEPERGRKKPTRQRGMEGRSLWYKEAMRGRKRVRAWARLTTFAVGSWLVVARAVRAEVTPFPRRFALLCPHVSRWSRLGARCLGIVPVAAGERPAAGSLVVANHQGYADVVTIGGLFPSIFAARHDMRAWPMFGALAASGATIFINRDNKRAGYKGVAQVTAALRAGATVVAFPEGTSTDGSGLLPFRTGVFQAAVDAGAAVVPAAITYVAIDGAPVTAENRDVVGWFRGEPFLGHILSLAGRRRTDAEVVFGPPIAPPHGDRRSLAAAAETGVRELLGLAAVARPAEIGRDPGSKTGAA
jgi:1-acyl-sn-glycerol-3-phosphate acyltransferase